MKNFLTLLFLITLCNSHASVIWNIPTPMQQDGMIHIDVLFQDNPNDTFSISLEPGGPPEMRTIDGWIPGSTFDPTAPWFNALDPSEQNRLFSSRWGFRVDQDSELLPSANYSIGIRMLNSTPGLESYFYRADPGTFTPVFLSSASHDYVLWNGTMWHPVFTMPNNTPENFTVTAEFEFFLADEPSNGQADSTTPANAVPNYSTSIITVTWQAIPEPSAALLALLAIPLWMLRRRPATR